MKYAAARNNGQPITIPATVGEIMIQGDGSILGATVSAVISSGGALIVAAGATWDHETQVVETRDSDEGGVVRGILKSRNHADVARGDRRILHEVMRDANDTCTAPVPMKDGKVSDMTRVERLTPTLKELAAERQERCGHRQRSKVLAGTRRSNCTRCGPDWERFRR